MCCRTLRGLLLEELRAPSRNKKGPFFQLQNLAKLSRSPWKSFQNFFWYILIKVKSLILRLTHSPNTHIWRSGTSKKHINNRGYSSVTIFDFHSNWKNSTQKNVLRRRPHNTLKRGRDHHRMEKGTLMSMVGGASLICNVIFSREIASGSLSIYFQKKMDFSVPSFPRQFVTAWANKIYYFHFGFFSPKMNFCHFS